MDYTGAKTRQAILAATDPERRDDAQKRFNAAWDRINKASTKLDELLRLWLHQENRDRLVQIQQALPQIREAQQATINTANWGGARWGN